MDFHFSLFLTVNEPINIFMNHAKQMNDLFRCQLSVDFIRHFQQFTPNGWLQRNSLLARQQFTILFVVFTDVNVNLAFEFANGNAFGFIQLKVRVSIGIFLDIWIVVSLCLFGWCTLYMLKEEEIERKNSIYGSMSWNRSDVQLYY